MCTFTKQRKTIRTHQVGAFLLGGMVVALVGGLHRLVPQQCLEQVACPCQGASQAALSQEEEQVGMHQEAAFLQDENKKQIRILKNIILNEQGYTQVHHAPIYLFF